MKMLPGKLPYLGRDRHDMAHVVMRPPNIDLCGTFSSRFGNEILISRISRLDYLPWFLKDMQVRRGLINKQKCSPFNSFKRLEEWD